MHDHGCIKESFHLVIIKRLSRNVAAPIVLRQLTIFLLGEQSPQSAVISAGKGSAHNQRVLAVTRASKELRVFVKNVLPMLVLARVICDLFSPFVCTHLILVVNGHSLNCCDNIGQPARVQVGRSRFVFRNVHVRPPLSGPGGNVSLMLAIAPAWPVESLGVAQRATSRSQARTIPVRVAYIQVRHAV